MQVHPQMQAILREQQQNPLLPPETLALADARAQFDAAQRGWNADLPPLTAQELVLGGVPCRRLSPADAGAGLIVFVHGGGWTFGSPATHERFARLLAVQAGVAVVAPDYRLAPEHPAPAAIEDLLAVLGTVEGPFVLCGDSAGANIALAAALAGSRQAALLSLLYGCFAPRFETESHRRNGAGQFGLSTERMRWYWRNWLGAAADPRAAPLEADLRGLPRCHLVAAGLDPLLDDSLWLAAALARDDVAVRLDVVPGVVHGFLQMSARLDPARDAVISIAAEIRAAINQTEGNEP